MVLNLNDTVFKYFSALTENQVHQFELLYELYSDWNQKVNVVSRKDIESLYLHHVLHSLSIAKFIKFKANTHIVDLGTGGGFPGIPLSIIFPECQFYLIDGKAKKIKVVQSIIESLDLKNCIARSIRSEELKLKFDFVLARAVTQFEKLIPLTQHLVSSNHINNIPNGLIALKGGNVNQEISVFGSDFDAEIIPINNYFEEDYFNEKYLVYIQI